MAEDAAKQPKEMTFSDLPDEVSENPALASLQDVPVPEPLRDPVDEDELAHREFREGEFWRQIPAFEDVDRDTFMDPAFQNRNSVKGPQDLRKFLGKKVSEEFYQDCERGFGAAPMNVRVTPYLLSCIDWDNLYHDPIRIQFLPTASTRLPDHPMLSLDSLHEQDDSPVPGLVHRYPDKALFLPLDVCPVYCRYCTRSYAIGGDTDTVEKDGFKPRNDRWAQAGIEPSRTSRRGRKSRTWWCPVATPSCSRASACRRSWTRCWRSRTSAASGSRPRGRPSCR